MLITTAVRIVAWRRTNYGRDDGGNSGYTETESDRKRLPSELLNLDHPALIWCFHKICLSTCEDREKPLCNGNICDHQCLRKKVRIVQIASIEEFRLVPTKASFQVIVEIVEFRAILPQGRMYSPRSSSDFVRGEE